MIYKTKFETILDSLTQDIITNTYAPGEQLTEKKLTQKYGVNQGTIHKVISALASQGMVTRKPKIGTIVLDIKDRGIGTRLGVFVVRSQGHLFENMFTLLAHKIQENHYFPLLVDIGIYSTTEETEKNIGKYLEQAINSSPAFVLIDGMINFPFDFLNKLTPAPKNLIFINRCETSIRFEATYILSDYEKGGYLGTEYLLKTGHKNILIVSMACKPCNLNTMRLCGVKKAFSERNLEFSDENMLIIKDKAVFEEELIQRFSGKRKPDGVFAFSDRDARRVQNILDRKKIFMGKDYDLVGYFNTPWAENLEPPMTSISINETALAELFAKVIKEKIFPKEVMKVEPILVVRNNIADSKKNKVKGEFMQRRDEEILALESH